MKKIYLLISLVFGMLVVSCSDVIVECSCEDQQDTIFVQQADTVDMTTGLGVEPLEEQ